MWRRLVKTCHIAPASRRGTDARTRDRRSCCTGSNSLQAVDPRNTLAGPACHFEDVRDGVRGPDVGGIALDCLPPGALRHAVIAGLLQTEGVAAENKAVARQ